MNKMNAATIIFQKGDTHEKSAIILFANLTSAPLTYIKVYKYDMASFGDIVDAGFINKEFKEVLPNQYVVIDELSSYDLEFTCDYTITYSSKQSKTTKLNFKLFKYGCFESIADDFYFKSLNVAGSIIKTT